MEYEIPEQGWVCFHCGARFMTPHSAAEHFGQRIIDLSACQIDAAYVRDIEAQLDRYRNEDSDQDRAINHLIAQEAVAVRRAEEEGYAKGLRDGRTMQAME